MGSGNKIIKNTRNRSKKHDKATCFLNEKGIAKITDLRNYVFSEKTISEIKTKVYKNNLIDGFIIFLSLCNANSRAIVIKGTGETLESAWENAENKAVEFISNTKKGYDVVWVRADIVNFVDEIPAMNLNKEIAGNIYPYFFRKGIALDKNFKIAFLEGELNGNGMLSYNNNSGENSAALELNNINKYLKYYNKHVKLVALPEKLITFTTVSFFIDEAGKTYELYADGLDSGRRTINFADDTYMKSIIINVSKYLYALIQPDGKFTYGYRPIFDKEIDTYNILRHTGSIWSLINFYRMTGNNELIPSINAAIRYLLEGYIEYKFNAAYIIERKSGEIKLGGNGLAIIMLTEYMDVFGTNKYIDVVQSLANGILSLEDRGSGKYYHVLNYPEYSLKEEFRTIYYDGEATFALTRAYRFTRKQKYLDGAAAAIENFIVKDYTKYRDHWVAYALNEITQYIPELRYYEFAMQNVGKNLDVIYHKATLHPVYLELFMAGWQTYERFLKSGMKSEYLEGFNLKYFAESIYKRVFHMLNGYFYPEIAMYMKAPDKIVNSFFIRNNSFRVRIDDIQHYISGNYFYTLYYDRILPYLSKEFIARIHNQ